MNTVQVEIKFSYCSLKILYILNSYNSFIKYKGYEMINIPSILYQQTQIISALNRRCCIIKRLIS